MQMETIVLICMLLYAFACICMGISLALCIRYERQLARDFIRYAKPEAVVRETTKKSKTKHRSLSEKQSGDMSDKAGE